MYFFRFPVIVVAGFAVLGVRGADFHPPGGDRYVTTSATVSVLPGGRVLRPLGTQLDTGPGPWSIAIARNGIVATADTGPERFGITIIDPPAKGIWRERQIWARAPRSGPVSRGIAFDESGKAIWITEGESGTIRELDLNTGDTKKTININNAEWKKSFAGDLAWDASRRLFFVADGTNSRIAVVDFKTARVLSSAPVNHQPTALVLSPDRATLYVTTAESVCAFDIRDSSKPVEVGCVATDSPTGIVATPDRIFVSNGNTDSITVLTASPFSATVRIVLETPGLEKLRGINAVGIVDTEKYALLGHLPAGWSPACVAIAGDRVYVTNALGRGTGPNLRRPLLELGGLPPLNRGMLNTFIMPAASEIIKLTGTVFANDGLVPWANEPAKLPAAIKHVVLIAKEGRTFDEVMGDTETAGNGRVLSYPRLARFGMHGLAIGGKNQFSVQDAPVTPNHHAAAQKWA